jgi:hypothetical protein
MSEVSAEAQLAECLDKFEPAVASLAVAALKRVRALVPGSFELVYDAYNALSIAFSTNEKLGGGFVGVVVYPRYVNLGFFHGAELEDPEGRLEGTGRAMRHVTVEAAADLRDKEIARLVKAAALLGGWKRGLGGALVLKKIYPKQRPRRPGVR